MLNRVPLLLRKGSNNAFVAFTRFDNGYLFGSHGSISVRVVTLPIPGVAAHFLEAVLSLPSEFTFGFGGIGITGGDVAGSTWLDAIWDFNAVDFLERLHQLEH